MKRAVFLVGKIKLASFALVDLWTVIFQGSLRVMTRPQLVFLGQNTVGEVIILTEVKVQNKASIVWTVQFDSQICEILQNWFIMRLDHSHQCIIIGVSQCVIPELGNAFCSLSVVLQSNFLHLIRKVFLSLCSLLLIFSVTWPINFITCRFILSTKKSKSLTNQFNNTLINSTYYTLLIPDNFQPLLVDIVILLLKLQVQF